MKTNLHVLKALVRQLTKMPGVRRLWARFPAGSIPLRVEFDVWQRPAYAYGIYSSAHLARSLGLRGITVLEFGVAGGSGLVNMEEIADQVARHAGIEIAVVGFDLGTGMPKSVDYRDLPYVWGEGFYTMDLERLKRRLRTAELVLGDVENTVSQFLLRQHQQPIGFIAFDLDYYSSTKQAFRIFDGAETTRLPRVYCYFDDVVYPEHACHNEWTGELCAIREYNEQYTTRKIAKIANFAWTRRYPSRWNDQMYVFHDFCHASYSRLITPGGDYYRQLHLI